MKHSRSRKSRRENYAEFESAADDVTISPFVSSAEIYRRFGSPDAGASSKDRGARDAFGDEDSDLWNKGSSNFRKRRRDALSKGRGAKGWAKDQAKDQNAEENSEATKPKRSKRNKNVGSEPGDRGESVGLRVIGGALRGSKLEYGGDRRVRPMKERVREAIFNLLGEDPKGRHVIDLFAGTGALTFEAISRGALSATMIEVHFPTARVARRNVDFLETRLPGTAAKIELITTDVYFWARNLAATDPDAPPPTSKIENISQARLPRDIPWLVFCSPPYDFWIDRQAETLALLRVLRDRAPEGSVFVVESDDRFDFDLLRAEISPKKRRSYPPAEVAIFRS